MKDNLTKLPLTQEEAHELGKPCEETDCQECCDHEWDSSEGFMCINCGAEYPW